MVCFIVLFVVSFRFNIVWGDCSLIIISLFARISSNIKALFSRRYRLGLTIYFVRLFVFILIQNLFGLIVYVFSVTSQLVITFSLAWVFWFSCVFLGFVKNWVKNVRHFVPLGTPSLLVSFMVMVEFVRLVVRSLTLSLRLAANLTAGHLMLGILSASFPIIMLMFVMELVVAFIQAYVFSILTLLYLEEVCLS